MYPTDLQFRHLELFAREELEQAIVDFAKRVL
jgi:hypothetical protein